MGRTRIAGGYDAYRAGKRARRVRRAACPGRKLHRHGPLWAEVRILLKMKLSPEQISATLRKRHPHEPQLQACHETIYTAIYAMPKGDLRRELSWSCVRRAQRAGPPSAVRASAARCRTCCPSMSGRPRPMIAFCPATGRAT